MQIKTSNSSMSNRNHSSIGQVLVRYLENRGVSIVFGIPGVHTLELYRGLESSNIRHITPRHEQGAGFMADGYARASGKPGVAFVISGPGITNSLTAMGQARGDSIPMLVVSGVNEACFLGKGLGHLHELPDQQGLCGMVALRSEQINTAEELMPALNGIFEDFFNKRPGPMHIQVPLDVFGKPFELPMEVPESCVCQSPDQQDLQAARDKLATARRPVLIAGGGSIPAANLVQKLAEMLNAPVVQTINARGQMHQHPLRVPASPSLKAVRTLLESSDTILAIGSELGPTDFDIYNTGEYPSLDSLIRLDIDPLQLGRFPADIHLLGQAQEILPLLIDNLPSETESGWGAQKADSVCKAARKELSPSYRHMITMVEAIRDTLPGSVIVGDSTQPIYAANFYYGHDTPRGWFNSSIGFGTLGYAVPAAIGAALAVPGNKVVCITGDGGAQFTLPEMMTARDENLPITFLIWNNFGFQEIVNAMSDADIQPVGCQPSPPGFENIARAFAMPYVRVKNNVSAVKNALQANSNLNGPVFMEIQTL